MNAKLNATFLALALLIVAGCDQKGADPGTAASSVASADADKAKADAAAASEAKVNEEIGRAHV